MDQSFGCIYEESLNLPENIWKCFPFNVAESSNERWQRHDLHRDQPEVRFFRRWLQHNQEKHQITPV